MHPSTILSTILIFSTALAAPTEDLTKRSCIDQYLPTLWHLNTQVSFPANPIQDQIILYRGRGIVSTLVEFTGVPFDAWGCSLELAYAPGHNLSVASNQGDASRVDVFAVSDEDLPTEVTWTSMDGYKGGLVGSFNFPLGAEQDSPKRIVINGADV